MEWKKWSRFNYPYLVISSRKHTKKVIGTVLYIYMCIKELISITSCTLWKNMQQTVYSIELLNDMSEKHMRLVYFHVHRKFSFFFFEKMIMRGTSKHNSYVWIAKGWLTHLCLSLYGWYCQLVSWICKRAITSITIWSYLCDYNGNIVNTTIYMFSRCIHVSH